mgnify:CR=1 FL=1
MGLFSFLQTKDINSGVRSFLSTENAVLLDVRTPEEYSEGHIEGSQNIPLQSIEKTEMIIKEKSTPIFVHCRSGARSAQATSIIKRMGYTNVEDIGGIMSYRGKVIK